MNKAPRLRWLAAGALKRSRRQRPRRRSRTWRRRHHSGRQTTLRAELFVLVTPSVHLKSAGIDELGRALSAILHMGLVVALPHGLTTLGTFGHSFAPSLVRRDFCSGGMGSSHVARQALFKDLRPTELASSALLGSPHNLAVSAKDYRTRYRLRGWTALLSHTGTLARCRLLICAAGQPQSPPVPPEVAKKAQRGRAETDGARPQEGEAAKVRCPLTPLKCLVGGET